MTELGGGPAAGAAGAPAAGRLRARRRRQALRLYGVFDPRTYFVIAVLSLGVLLAAWWLAAAFDATKDIFLPTPPEVWDRAVELARSGDLGADIKTSFLRVTIGFAISTAMAVPIGVLMGAYRWSEAALEPAVDFVRYMPVVGFVPLTIIWVGVGDNQKWLIVWIGTFFQQVLLIQDIVKRVPHEYVDIGRTLGLRDLPILARIAVPASAPAMWDATRIMLGWAWTWLVLAELVGANAGLGHRITTAQRYFDTAAIFVAMLVIGLMGLLMDQLMRFAGMRLFPWAERQRP